MKLVALAIVVAGGLIGAAIVWGMWLTDYNTPFNQCVRAFKEKPDGGVPEAKCIVLMNYSGRSR